MGMHVISMATRGGSSPKTTLYGGAFGFWRTLKGAKKDEGARAEMDAAGVEWRLTGCWTKMVVASRARRCQKSGR